MDTSCEWKLLVNIVSSALLEITKKSTRNTMNNEHNDAECESVDKIEVLETIYDTKNDESNAFDAKNLILELKRQKLILQEIKDQEEKLLQAKKAETSIKFFCSSISNLMEAVKEVKSAKDLTDQEIECILPEAVEKWKTDLEDLSASKVELVKELVGKIWF